MRTPPVQDPLAPKITDPRDPPGLVRDQWDRPMLIPAGGTIKVPYTRASSLADFITNRRGLVTWQKRYMIRGMGLSQGLALAAARETYNTGFGMTDTKENAASGKRLDAVGEQAMEMAQVHARAEYGTEVHQHMEQGTTPEFEVMANDVRSLRHGMRGFQPVAQELFVACDEVMSAGSFDVLVRQPGVERLRIVDYKTGKLHIDGWKPQLAVYANGDIYDPETNERFSLESQFGPIDTEVGIIGHTMAQTGKTVFYEIDISIENARLAAKVRDYQQQKHQGSPINLVELAYMAASEALERLVNVVSLYTTADAPAHIRKTLDQIYEEFSDVWDANLTALANEALSESIRTM